MPPTPQEPGEFALFAPQIPFDPEDFALDSDPRGEDAWLIEAAQGDVVLLTLLLSKERLGLAHTEGLTDENYMERMLELGRKITTRQSYLEDLR